MMTQSLASPPVTISGAGDRGVSFNLGARMGVVTSIMAGAGCLPLGVEEWTCLRAVRGTGESALRRLDGTGCSIVPNFLNKSRDRQINCLYNILGSKFSQTFYI